MSSTPDNMDDTRATKTRSGRSLRRGSPSLHTRSSSPMCDKQDDKNESSHTKEHDDDPSHMGDDNDQHDEHDDNDETQAIATYTQAQLASMVGQAVHNAINQERTKFHSQVTNLEQFHREEVENIRNDFTRLLQEATTNVPTETPPKTRFFTPHTKRQQDIDYARLTAGSTKNVPNFLANSARIPHPDQLQPKGHLLENLTEWEVQIPATLPPIRGNTDPPRLQLQHRQL